MIDGSMQEFALTLNKFLEHAAKWHPRAEVVTGRDAGKIDRVSYADLAARSRRISAVLHEYGIGRGDRVATLAWNTQAHVEAWYAIMGMGAVCHTLNPRLTPAQLAAMLAQSGCRVIVASADLVPLAQQIVERTSTVARVLIIDGTAEAWKGARQIAVTLDDAMGGEARMPAVWGDFDERTPSGLCFTSGTTGSPKGVTYTHRSSFLHTLRLLQADVF